MLVPRSMFTDATNYFLERFCGSSFEIIYEDSITLSYNTACMVGLLLTLRYQHLYPVRWRVVGPLWLLASALVVCCIFVTITQVSSGLLFTFTMSVVLLSGLSVACLQGGFVALATLFPPEYLQALLIGQGVAGLVVSLAAIFTELASTDDSCSSTSSSTSTSETCSEYSTNWSTLVYFVIGASVLLTCLAMYPVLEKLPFTRYCMTQGEVMVASDDPVSDAECRTVVVDEDCGDGAGGWTVDRNNGNGHSKGRGVSTSGLSFETPSFQSSASKNLLPANEATVIDEPKGFATSRVKLRGASRGVRAELAAIAPLAYTVFVNYVVTIALHPGATTLIVSWRECLPGYSRFFSKNIFVLFSFVSFNAFDLIGRFSPSVLDPLPNSWLPVAASLRVVFFPLMLGCHTDYSRIPVYLSSDAYPLVIIPLLGFTSGLLTSRALMAGSRYGPWAATALTLFLVGGNLAGALLAFLVTYAITGSFT